MALLSRGPYSATDPVRTHTIGIALERQQGVHAVGSARREDFDTWPGTMAYTPPGVDVFSESEKGGEYLVVRWNGDMELDGHQGTDCRVYWWGHAHGLLAAQHLRCLLLDQNPDTLAIEQAAFGFIGLVGQREQDEPTRSAGRDDRKLRLIYGRVLDRIACDFAQPLTVTQLAQAEGKTPLRFLREFTQLVGATPHAYIVETRVQAARAMMQCGTETLASVALNCGFSHQSHMGVAFRKVLQQTPGRYLASRKATSTASAYR